MEIYYYTFLWLANEIQIKVINQREERQEETGRK